MFKLIYEELSHHSRFTVFGAITGIFLMMFFYKLPSEIAFEIFYILHPAHVLLSAIATASMFRLHMSRNIRGNYNIIILFIIGYSGSIGIATISDSIIPYLGEIMLNLPDRGIHLGFIEKWWLINPLALLGIVFACFRPQTKFPHYGHVLLSTWASLFHIVMAAGGELNIISFPFVFIFLFVAVWLPCCGSDIVFPLLFVDSSEEK